MISNKYCVKIKLCTDPTSQKSDLYEFKNTLFDNGDPKEFFFKGNFNMTLKASVTLKSNVKIQFLRTMGRV